MLKKELYTLNAKEENLVKTLYQESFPPYEIRTWQANKEAMKNSAFHCDTYWAEESLVGLLFYWEADAFTYLEHLAVSKNVRNQNYGTKLVLLFLENHPSCILEIDPPETEIAVRRQHFYERLGFFHNDYPYLHLSYSIKPKPHYLHIMSYGKLLTPEEFETFTSFMKNGPMQYLG